MSVGSDIPALPIAYVRALQLLREPDADVARLAAVANDDPAFAATLIRLANSASSSPLSRIRTVQNAIVRIGVPGARRAIIGVTLQQAFRGVGGSQVDERELWRHLVAVGMFADDLAWGRVEFSDAFTAGLLHDVGRLSMASEDPRRYAQVVAQAWRGEDVNAVERQAFGIAHDEWGAAIGQKWGFPDDIVDAIADHHDGGASGLSWVLRRAREQARAMGIGDGVLVGDRAGDVSSLDAGDAMLRRVNTFVSSIGRAA